MCYNSVTVSENFLTRCVTGRRICEMEATIIIFRKEVMVLWQKSRTQQDVQRNPVPAVPVQERAQARKLICMNPMNMYSSIKKVIGVVSGKGGVGKSLVTASLARMMRAKGYNVGIMDADITGPSIPKMYGLHEMVSRNRAGNSSM